MVRLTVFYQMILEVHSASFKHYDIARYLLNGGVMLDVSFADAGWRSISLFLLYTFTLIRYSIPFPIA